MRATIAFLSLTVIQIACAFSVPTVQASLPTVTNTPLPTVATVTAMKSLNVRSRPGTASRVIDVLYNGDSVTLTGVCDHGWAEIVWESGTAWVNSKYLSYKCKEE